MTWLNKVKQSMAANLLCCSLHSAQLLIRNLMDNELFVKSLKTSDLATLISSEIIVNNLQLNKYKQPYQVALLDATTDYILNYYPRETKSQATLQFLGFFNHDGSCFLLLPCYGINDAIIINNHIPIIRINYQQSKNMLQMIPTESYCINYANTSKQAIFEINNHETKMDTVILNKLLQEIQVRIQYGIIIISWPEANAYWQRVLNQIQMNILPNINYDNQIAGFNLNKIVTANNKRVNMQFKHNLLLTQLSVALKFESIDLIIKNSKIGKSIIENIS